MTMEKAQIAFGAILFVMKTNTSWTSKLWIMTGNLNHIFGNWEPLDNFNFKAIFSFPPSTGMAVQL